MNCMKCGRQIEEGAVFCLDCLSEMANYPVKPGTVVLLPTRSSAPAQKKPPRRLPTPEEQVKILTRRIRRLSIGLLVSLLLLAAAVFVLHLPQTQQTQEKAYSAFRTTK